LWLYIFKKTIKIKKLSYRRYRARYSIVSMLTWKVTTKVAMLLLELNILTLNIWWERTSPSKASGAPASLTSICGD